MNAIKVLVLAVLGFTIPVSIAVELGPRIFKTTPRSQDPSVRASLRPTDAQTNATDQAPGEDRVSQTPEQPQGEPSSAFRSIASDVALDPNPDSYFVVSTLLKVSNTPARGKRQKFIAKYTNKATPFPGWAIALRQTDTSLRPEVYWQNAGGHGGWYTFDHIHVDRSRWYALTLVAKDNELLSLYYEDLGPAGDREPVAHVPSGEEEETVENTTGVRFLGGYNLSGVQLEPTDAQLQFAPRFLEAGDMRGELGNVLIARPAKLSKNPSRIKEFLAGGCESLKGRLDAGEVALWIDLDGHDESKYHRAISQETQSKT